MLLTYLLTYSRKNAEPAVQQDWTMFCCPRCSHLSTILNMKYNIVEPESGVTIMLTTVNNVHIAWAAKHCSILFSSILQQPDRF